MTHSVWVNPAGDGALYGENIRKTVIASEGNLLVGCDMKSAQLSIAGFYANNAHYYHSVAEGDEFIIDEDTKKEIYVGESAHCVNARAFLLVSEAEWKEAVRTQDKDLIHSITLRRKASKPVAFSSLFGASGKKVASELGVSDAEGESKRKAFLETLGLDETIRICELMVETNKRGSGGYIELPFGYYNYCTQKHKYINYLIQGCEAACQKYAINHFHNKIWELGILPKGQTFMVIDMHDETLCDVPKDIAEDVAKVMCEAYTVAGQECYEWTKNHSRFFKGANQPTFAFDLNGGYKLGNNYYDCH